MALNKTFTCNVIKDENENDINCYYQGYHVRTGTWNDVRFSDYNQYSCNLGDGDWLTQTGEVFTGDTVILVFWNSNEGNRSGLKDRLCTISLTLTEDSTYVNDVQLRPKTAPQCGFTFNDNTPTINNEISAIPSTNDNFTYTYNGILHYHYRELSNELIFDSIGNINLKYDWDEGNSWEDFTSYTYTTIGDYNVSQRATNSYSLSKICTQALRIKYNPPIPGLYFDYISPIHTTEDVTINSQIQDDDNRITSIKHKLIVRDRDNNDLLQDIEIDENSDKTYSYLRTIQLLQKHDFGHIIYWNDGFQAQTINYTKNLPIENWCPEVTVIKEDTTAMDKIFKQTSSDLDGSIVAWDWKIFFIPPFSSGEYVEVHSYNAINANDWSVGFTVGGSYKVQIEVQDDYGCKTLDFTEFEIAADCPDTTKECISQMKFIFPQQMIN